LEIENKAKILILGAFGPNDIEVHMTERRMPCNPELAKKIEEEWESKANQDQFAGPLVRVECFGLTPEGKLALAFGKTDFKEYFGSRSLQSLRRYGYKRISNPLSVSVALITSDDKMLIAEKVQSEPKGSIDAIGGYVHPEEDFDSKTGVINIFQSAYREVWEEVQLKAEEVSESWCLGFLYEYAGLCHPVASFVFLTQLTSKEIRQRKTDEINVLVVRPQRSLNSNGGKYVMQLLYERHPHVEPDGRLTIALARKLLAGKYYQKQVIITADNI
jgi:8-oxo-dGTP pyrophosphatase MutT (NUDIX family)